MNALGYGCGSAATQIINAVGDVVIAVKKVSNDHEVAMANITNQHKQAMARLNGQQLSEEHRHKEIMALLDGLFKAISTLGREIFEAEGNGYKGLPGNQR